MAMKQTEDTNSQTGTGETLFHSRAEKETDYCCCLHIREPFRTDFPASDAVVRVNSCFSFIYRFSSQCIQDDTQQSYDGVEKT